MLSGYSEPKRWNKLVVAPIWMKNRFLKLIEREAENAKQGNPAHIMGKMNALCDPVIMAALYYASSCGVKIELLVRGICCLRVGIPGVSENIQVRSIVGDFLEHSRIFYFYNGGHEEIFMGSADWMPRNLDRRVEIVFPVEDERIKGEVMHVLDLEFKDNVKAHLLLPDGTYVKQDKRGKVLINSQMEFCREAREKAVQKKKKEKKRNHVSSFRRNRRRILRNRLCILTALSLDRAVFRFVSYSAVRFQKRNSIQGLIRSVSTAAGVCYVAVIQS